MLSLIAAVIIHSATGFHDFVNMKPCTLIFLCSSLALAFGAENGCPGDPEGSFDHWISFENYGLSCYLMTHEKYDYINALQYCADIGGRLVDIQSQEVLCNIALLIILRLYFFI